MLVTTTASAPSSTNVPSLSSASTTKSVAVAPRRAGADLVDVAADDERRLHAGVDEHRARASTRSSSCRACPRPATVLRSAAIDARISARRSTGTPFARAAAHLGVALGDRRRHRDELGVAEVRAVVPDGDLDAHGGETIEPGGSLEIAAAHRVPHRGEDRRDRAHARAPDAHDVDASRRRQINRLDRHGVRLSFARITMSVVGRSCRSFARMSLADFACSWARRATRSWASSRATVAALAAMRRAGRAPRGGCPPRLPAGRRRTAHRAPAPRRRRRRARAAFAVWWSPGAPGSGTRTEGSPTAASSATLVAPDRHTTRSAAA